MKPSTKLHHWAFSRWYDRAKTIAMQDPRYTEIERIRHTDVRTGEYHPDRVTVRFLDDELGWEQHEEQHVILNRVPKPWYLRALDAYRDHVHIPTWYAVRTIMHRARHGWGPADVDQLDTYLSRVIAESVRYLRDQGNTYDGRMTAEEWAAQLTMVADAFERWANRWEESIDNYDEYKVPDEVWEFLKTYWGSLWD